MGHVRSIGSLQLHPVTAVMNLRIWLEHDWWGLSVFLTLKEGRFLHYNMSVETWFKAATSLFVCYEQCDVSNPLFEWINTPPFKICYQDIYYACPCTGVKLGKNYCFPENDENFLNNTANIWNVETCIIRMLLYQKNMKTSSIIHMYHYSPRSVHKLLTDLTKHGKIKENETLSIHYLYIRCMYMHMYICTYTCMCMCV
jgi:hypothetical protein